MIELLLANNYFFEFDWFFTVIQEIFNFFSKLSCFALTPTGEFINFVNGDIAQLEYIFAKLSFDGSNIAGDFAITRNSFGGAIAGLLGFPISLFLEGVPSSLPLVIGILVGVAEWYFIISIAKFLIGLVF